MNNLTDLVYMTKNHSGVFTNTLIITEHFGRKHKNVLAIVERHLKNGSISRLNIKPSNFVNTRGRSYKMYEVDYKAFLVVVLSFTGKDADQLKGKFVDLFLSQSKELELWRDGRRSIKEGTKALGKAVEPISDRLKQDYPDSSRGARYYQHLHIAVNEVVIGTGKGINRDFLTIEQMIAIGRLEKGIAEVIDYLGDIDSPSELIRWYSLATLNAKVKRVKKLEL